MNECASPIAWSGVDDHARGFVNDEQVSIFVEDVKWEVFGGNWEVAGEGCEMDVNLVTRGRLV